MENWKTGGNPLKVNHFEFPGGLRRFMEVDITFSPGTCGQTCVQKTGAGTSIPPRRPEPVTRRYRPEPAALDELVEVLFRLLVDVPGTDSGIASAPAKSTCFSGVRK